MRVFEDSWRRIDRAIGHARVITQRWPTMLDPNATPEIVHKEGIQHVAQVRVKRKDDNDLSLEIGEFFYQLRAALDGVAYQTLILESGINPPPLGDKVEFPIYDDPTRFAKCPLMTTAQFPPTIRKWLESIQPYKAATSGDPYFAEVGRRIKVLHDCARKDRHRRLHLVVASISSLKIKFSCANVIVSNVQPIPIDFLSEDIEFLSFDINVIDPTRPTRLQLHTKGLIDIGMPELPDHFGIDLMGELERIMIGVREIVEFFEQGYLRNVEPPTCR